jgi:manganese/zinc/iron transport system substrate-binding protein
MKPIFTSLSRRLASALCGGLALALLSACGDPAGPRDDGRIEVVATTGMIADLARAVGGEHVAVTTLIREGLDPHLYIPASSDVKRLQGADLVLYNGLHLEGKLDSVLARIGSRGKPVVAVAAAVAEAGYPVLDDEDGSDPHLWMDVAAWMQVVEAIRAALAEALPERAESFASNAAAYLETLAALDAYARETLATIPESRRVLVTAHDAFGYLSRAYGIEVRGIQGISTESEAGIRDIEDLVAFLVARDIPAVFVESSVSDRNVRALIEGAAARGHAVEIGGELYSDSTGPAGTYEGTYVGMIDHNVTTIARALGGTPPENGFRSIAEAP